MTRLEAIRARLEAATPGPWHYPAKEGGLYVCFGNIQDDKIVAAVTHEQNEMALFRPNMELIAHAPSDLRALLTALDVAVGALEYYASEHNWYLHKDASTGAEVRRSIELFDTESSGTIDEKGNNYLVVTAGKHAKAALKQIEEVLK